MITQSTSTRMLRRHTKLKKSRLSDHLSQVRSVFQLKYHSLSTELSKLQGRSQLRKTTITLRLLTGKLVIEK